MMTMEEMAAKIEALETRLGWLERAAVAKAEMEREQLRGSLGGESIETIAAEMKRYPSSRKDAVKMVRELLRPLMLVLPSESRPKLIAEGSPSDMIRGFVVALGAQFGPEQCAMLDIAANDAEAHALTWDDVGVGEDGVLR